MIARHARPSPHVRDRKEGARNDDRILSHGLTGNEFVGRTGSLIQCKSDITESEAKRHPNKNLITRAVGTSETVFADTFNVVLREGDRLLLCSDGLSNIVEDEQLCYEVLKSDNTEECCNMLVKAALENGAPDNVTAALIRI